jgi:hypothetical protein
VRALPRAPKLLNGDSGEFFDLEFLGGFVREKERGVRGLNRRESVAYERGRIGVKIA